MTIKHTMDHDGIYHTKTVMWIEVCGIHGGGVSVRVMAGGETVGVSLSNEEARHLVAQINRIVDRNDEMDGARLKAVE